MRGLSHNHNAALSLTTQPMVRLDTGKIVSLKGSIAALAASVTSARWTPCLRQAHPLAQLLA
ncbi:hypothetical protein V1283_003249 [Bradyrhizobium sp. AZCC 2262]